jgi:hypothetical protein
MLFNVMTSLFYLIFILHSIYAQEKFNVFKSYADSERKPPQYSREKKYLRHSIKEYLDSKQLHMYKNRYARDTPENMFDSNWSGFKKYNAKTSSNKYT